jgi:hypothetical protein
MRNYKAVASQQCFNREAEESAALEAVTRQQPAKTQQTEESLMRAVVNCRACELATAL